ncbi:NAD(+) diphosphatase [Actinotalea sp. AC32]|nr:NAD(+) diphosphatase [Actinotalea sp. AC32]
MDWTRLPLARGTVDRAAHRRGDPRTLLDGWGETGTRLVLVRDGRLAVHADDAGTRLATPAPQDVPHLAPGRAPEGTVRVFLGVGADGGAVHALVLPDTEGDVDIEGVPTGPADPPGVTWATLRDVGHLLDDEGALLGATAVGLAAWHERHPRCPRCGARTEPATSGWTRRCTADGSEHYPRTDPAVIMAVVDDDDRLLLGHATHWPARRFSTLAGFVEPGESVEAAVRREVQEEVGLAVGEVVYQGSQPWPFPASLMLACTARATATRITVDHDELADARWFTRDELAAAVDAGDVLLPMRTSVARALIEQWFGGPLGPSD